MSRKRKQPDRTIDFTNLPQFQNNIPIGSTPNNLVTNHQNNNNNNLCNNNNIIDINHNNRNHNQRSSNQNNNNNDLSNNNNNISLNLPDLSNNNNNNNISLNLPDLFSNNSHNNVELNLPDLSTISFDGSPAAKKPKYNMINFPINLEMQMNMHSFPTEACEEQRQRLNNAIMTPERSQDDISTDESIEDTEMSDYDDDISTDESTEDNEISSSEHDIIMHDYDDNDDDIDLSDIQVNSDGSYIGTTAGNTIHSSTIRVHRHRMFLSKNSKLKRSKKESKRRRKRIANMNQGEIAVYRRLEAEKKRKRRSRGKKPGRYTLSKGIESFDNSKIEYFNVGKCDQICPHCKAKLWLRETIGDTKKKQNWSLCCKNGSISLEELPEPPTYLKDLFNDRDSPDAKYFHLHIRKLNCALALGWLQCNQVKFKSGISVFKINGQIYNRIPAITPNEGEPHRFAQIYILDPQQQLNRRLQLNGVTGKNGKFTATARRMLTKLQTLLMEHNPLVQKFRNAFEVSKSQGPFPTVSIVLQKDVKGVATRTYNQPTVDQIAAVMPTNSEPDSKRTLTINYKNGDSYRINETSPLYEPMQYPLFYPFATLSWPSGVKSVTKKKPTQAKYYAYRLVSRTNSSNILLRGSRLTQQWVVDMYCKVLQWKLNWVRNKQKEIRADLYKGLEDQTSCEDVDLQFIGKKIILPASFSYTPRWYDQKYRDAMAIISRYKKPDLFITFTCNPKWEEIEQELEKGQNALDRPGVCARIFQQKKKELLHDLTVKNVLGKAVAWMHTIEFQKRGLPHAHILVIFHPSNHLLTTDDYDRVVVAEIPDPEKEPELHKLVLQFMIHTPCENRPSAACRKDNRKRCCSHFPKEYRNYTFANDDGYPEYKRRAPRYGGHIGKKRVGFRGLTEITNKWVVPYNPYLLKKYKAHINVEVCSSILAIKYLYKYIYKGHDKVSFALRYDREKKEKKMNRNEILRYFDAFYIAGAEACWKLFEFPMHSRSPAVFICKIHLPNEQLIYYHPDDNLNTIMNNEKTQKTMLTQWFANNKKEIAQPLTTKQLRKDVNGNILPRGIDLLYHQYVEHYSWKSTPKIWKRRPRCRKIIGRMHRLSPKSGEIYYLRLLLLHVKGATSWDDLKLNPETNEIENSFKEAAAARGLLLDDLEWNKAMQEAAEIVTSGEQLVSLFVTILLNCEVSKPLQLFIKHKEAMAQALVYRLKDEANIISNKDVRMRAIELKAENIILSQIEKSLKHAKKTMKQFNLPKPNYELINCNPELDAELNYDPRECKKIVDENKNLMNQEQEAFYEVVIESIDKDLAKIFFLDALGGTGKTFVAKTILAEIRRRRHVAIAVAFSGIAALLLPGGKTVHSRFSLPINFDETTLGDIKHQSHTAEVLRKAKVIIWDEAPMANRDVLECINRTLCDLIQDKQRRPFGGKTMVLSGDFRQVLPVVKRAGRAQIVQACINRSYLWKYVEVHSLKINERIKRRATNNNLDELQKFADTLEKIGDGTFPINEELGEDMIRIPDKWLSQSSNLQEFINEAFPNIATQCESDEYLKGRAILTPLNATAQQINNEILKQLPFMDSPPIKAVDTNRADTKFCHSEEDMNNCNPSGLPPSKLYLKERAVIMVLRNINPAAGLCNGTRLKVDHFSDRIIKATILTGPKSGKTVIIPRITLFADETAPISFKRRQFPVKLAFAMTINKAQGQTLDFMALYLPEPVFGHGQLYVACGRVGSEDQLTIFIQPGDNQGIFDDYEGIYTRNVVYQEVFNDRYSYVDFDDNESQEDSDESQEDNSDNEYSNNLRYNSKRNISNRRKSDKREMDASSDSE